MPKPTSISTNGKPILNKGEACARCKARKVRCSGCRPTCRACARSALHRGEPNPPPCRYFGGPAKASSRRRKATVISTSESEPESDEHREDENVASAETEQQPPPEHGDAPPSPTSPPPVAIDPADSEVPWDQLSAWQMFESVDLSAPFTLPSLEVSDPFNPVVAGSPATADLYESIAGTSCREEVDWSYWGWLEREASTDGAWAS